MRLAGMVAVQVALFALLASVAAAQNAAARECRAARRGSRGLRLPHGRASSRRSCHGRCRSDPGALDLFHGSHGRRRVEDDRRRAYLAQRLRRLLRNRAPSALSTSPIRIPNVVYAGTGSACIRSNIVTGRGVYRSTDAGRTWSFLGLRDSGADRRHRGAPQGSRRRLRCSARSDVRPQRRAWRLPQYGRRSETWTKVLEGSERTGAVDLAIDPSNPRHLFAALWRAERKPWTILSGGDLSGLYRSRDGGDTWQQVTDGLPAGLVGKIAVEVSPANPDRVWALVEAEGTRERALPFGRRRQFVSAR